jgi:glycosyltransferase involved in cell wall biosynthesis
LITTLINTRDEEVHIERAVRSAIALGPVFVVDSGSDDDTVAIARAGGAEVVEHEWAGYAEQKNWAREHLPLTTDWVLHLDADEFLTPISRAEIARAVASDDRSGYYIPRQNIFLGRLLKHAWWYPDYQLRLFRRDRGRYEERSVHEHVILDAEVGFLEHPIMHESLKGIDAFLARHVRYAGLEAAEGARDSQGRALRAGRLLSNWPERRRALKRLVWTRMPSRAAVRFAWMFLVRRGYRDGPQGRVYSELIAAYEAMIDAKELEARTAELPAAGGAAGLDGMRDQLVCPDCREGLEWRADHASCATCRARFPIVNGVGMLLPSRPGA